MESNNSSIVVNKTVTECQKRVYSIAVPAMIVLCVTTAILNLIISMSIRWSRKPRSPTLYFSISLALADAFASTVLGIGLLVNSLLPVVFSFELKSNCFQLTLEAFRLGGILVSITHLVVLSINHYTGIARPLEYESTMTRRRSLKIILWSWFLPTSLMLIYFSMFADQGFRSEHCENDVFLKEIHFRRLFGILFFFPLVVMISIYTYILFIVKKHQRFMYQNNPHAHHNMKGIKTTVLILGTYIVGYMPAVVWSMILCTDCTMTPDDVSKESRMAISITINTLVIVKMIIDPIIYAARMSDIKNALKKMRTDISTWICHGFSRHDNTVELSSFRGRNTSSARTTSNETTL